MARANKAKKSKKSEKSNKSKKSEKSKKAENSTKRSVPVKKSAKKSVKKPAKKSVNKTKVRVAATMKSVGKPASKPMGKSAKKPAGKPVTKPVAKKAGAKPGKTLEKKPGQSKTLSSKGDGAKPAAALSKIFTPLDDRIVIQRAGAADRTPGGLYIPDTVTDRPNQGRVIAVGRGHRDKKGRVRPLDVQLGDTVMYSPFAGSELKVSGVEVLVLREDEVLAIVKS